jgi:hypothetical protein
MMRTKRKIILSIRMNQSCRFCYDYKPPGVADACCPPVVCASTMISIASSMTSTPSMNSAQATEQSLLLAYQRQFQIAVESTIIGSTIQSTIENSAAITAQLQAQLEDITFQRYAPYRPYIYPVVPSSVTDLAMRTANVGNPMPPITILDCKGNQFVTK